MFLETTSYWVTLTAITANLEFSAGEVYEVYPWSMYEHTMQLFIMNTVKKIDAASLQMSPNQELAYRINKVCASASRIDGDTHCTIVLEHGSCIGVYNIGTTCNHASAH